MISVLGVEIELPKDYVNQFTLSWLDAKDANLSVMVETGEGTLATIKEIQLKVENAALFDPSGSVLPW